MKKGISIAGGALLFTILSACHEQTPEAPAAHAAAAGQAAPSPAAASGDPVKRGEYLVAIMGCHDCHTPMKNGPNGPEPDMTRMLSGHPEALGKMPPAAKLTPPWMWSGAATNTAFAGPWGVSYSMNLTSDPKTGIGLWNERIFIDSIRNGKQLGAGRPIMPPMPWPAYKQATDDDLKAIFAYLKSTAPIVNKVPDYEPPAK
jgi:mono/diheme cytochrome c family protein